MARQQFEPRIWGRWVASFIGFPLAGLAARAVAGNIDDVRSAAVGGLVGGTVLGAVQAFALRPSMARRPAWIGATALGMAAGLTAGATAVDFATDTASAVAMGALTGLGVGAAQALALQASTPRRLVWASSTVGLWALGWWVTSMVIVDMDRQHANFGASGAILATLIGGLVLAVRPEDDWSVSGTADATTAGTVRSPG